MKVSPRGGEKNPLERLQIKVKMKRKMLSWEWIRVQVLDFHADGMVIRTDEDLPLDGRSVFSVHLAMEFDEISINKLECVALNREKVCSCFDYPMKFDLSNYSVANQQGIAKSLQRIDSVLSSYNSLVNRMKSGPISAN